MNSYDYKINIRVTKKQYAWLNKHKKPVRSATGKVQRRKSIDQFMRDLIDKEIGVIHR